jgi:hypothetical protein
MPSSHYYREQARVLLLMMLAMRDSKRAARVGAKARAYLAQANLPDEEVRELNVLLEEYNNSQMRRGPRHEG